ncbi:hypothetical protein HU200_021727 [Digitaria exilis]|uniref:F-box domain-containing protein n=1 Tax=Digitaria exilis TaxID=1010633 RepID=A0A835K9A9_9POAL|nr:hypothetical protein HU200_021727 [Digitaria exilis]
MEARSRSAKKRRVVRLLPDDLVAEILARVSYRSLCRFKSVSRSWRVICSDPAVRRRCHQTLAGFFFRTAPLGGRPSPYVRHFVNASGRGTPMVDPSLSFLPLDQRNACILDSCNGILLCVGVGSRYFVCNPATEKWIDLPDREAAAPAVRGRLTHIIRLGFDPAVSSHFSVFVVVNGPEAFDGLRNHVRGVEIYSSETGAWTHRQSEWGAGTVAGWDSVFFNGTLHLTSPNSSSLLTVDRDGKMWGRITTPRVFDFVGVSKGHLHAVHINDRRNRDRLSIWVLENYAGQQWILKHTVSATEMFGIRPRSFGDSYSFKVHAIHPEHGLIFLTAGKLSSLMSYNMDEKRVRFIWTLGENMSAHPYVPSFSEWLLPGH